MFNSKKKTAINLLKEQRHKLNNNDTYLTNVWVFQTSEILKTYLGQNSTFYKSAQQMTLQIKESGKDEFMESKKYYQSRAELFINGCIEYVEKNGVYKERHPNILSKLSDEIIWIIYAGSIAAAFSAGIWWANAPFNPKNYPAQNDTSIERPLPTVAPLDSANLNTD